MSYIVVQNYMNLPEKASNSVPFSWRIKDYLDELWVHTQYITGDAGEPSSCGRGCVLQEETLIPCHRASPPFESWTTRTPGCLAEPLSASASDHSSTFAQTEPSLSSIALWSYAKSSGHRHSRKTPMVTHHFWECHLSYVK